MMSKAIPHIALLMGDAAGIGPELTVEVMQDKKLRRRASIVVIGSSHVLARAAEVLGANTPIVSVANAEQARDLDGIPVIECDVQPSADFRWGVADAASGANVVEQLTRAVEMAASREIDGVVFAPLNKEAMHKAGSIYADEIAFLGALTDVDVRTVVTWNGIYRSSVTGHVPLRAVPDMMTMDRIVPVIRNLWERMGDLGVEPRRIGVAGLNPHAGEGGAFGDEEIEVIAPAIEAARTSGIEVSGPHSPDTIFVRAMRGEFNGVVFQYHDQGNAPMKTAAFGEGAILYSGLPFPCTSVTHGSAYDIAGTGKADAGTLLGALEMVVGLCGQA